MKNTYMLVLLVPAALLGWSMSASAQEQFSTPDKAVEGLVAAAKAGDTKAILTVLGPDGQAVISSGDPVADINTRENFVAVAYEAKHAIELEGDVLRGGSCFKLLSLNSSGIQSAGGLCV